MDSNLFIIKFVEKFTEILFRHSTLVVKYAVLELKITYLFKKKAIFSNTFVKNYKKS